MRSSKQITLFIFLLVMALFLIFAHSAGKTGKAESIAAKVPGPVVYIFNGLGNGFKSFFSYFSSVASVGRQNAELKEQLIRLEQENVTLQANALENEKLRKELNYRSASKYNLVSANVIAKDPSGFNQSVIIDAGADDGISVGAAVLAQGVLVGRVTSTNSGTAKVLLVTDPQSVIDAQIAATGDNGLLRGSYGSGIIVDMISQNVQINRGDAVVSAGLNTDLPSGLLIGTIGDLQSQKNDLLQKATVISPIDLKNLDIVSVIKK